MARCNMRAMGMDDDVRAFERAVESGDTEGVTQNAGAALRLLRARAVEAGEPELQAFARKVATLSPGVAGVFQAQEILVAAFLNAPMAWELRLNGVYQQAEGDRCWALFDTRELALAYVAASRLPEGQRFTDPSGITRSFREDSVLWDANDTPSIYIEAPMGSPESMLFPMVPWNRYGRGRWGEPAPAVNPPPPSGALPVPPVGSRMQEVVAP